MRLDNFDNLKKEVDYIIVGQGIAGTLLGFQMLQKGKSIYVIDKGYKNSSSYVAAGLINPIVLKRITKTWRAEEYLTYNEKFYTDLNNFFDKIFYQKLSFSKLISSTEEKDFWYHRYNIEDIKNYIEKDLEIIYNKEQFSKDFVEGKVKQTAWLNIKPLLSYFRKYLLSKNSIIEEVFNNESLTILNKSIKYNHVEAKKIIFCEGAKISENPYFNYLPMVLNKGELLTIESNDFYTSKILKKKIFILPVKENTYKIGSTFEWKWDSEKPTNSKKQELEFDLKKITNKAFSVIKHEAGVRPSSRDRRPIIGLHHQFKQLAIFNGLGSRGCLMAPLLTEEFVSYLEGKGSIRKEADIARFDKFKPNSTS